jgi:hypothetical protein
MSPSIYTVLRVTLRVLLATAIRNLLCILYCIHTVHDTPTQNVSGSNLFFSSKGYILSVKYDKIRLNILENEIFLFLKCQHLGLIMDNEQ